MSSKAAYEYDSDEDEEMDITITEWLYQEYWQDKRKRGQALDIVTVLGLFGFTVMAFRLWLPLYGEPKEIPSVVARHLHL